MQAEGARLLAGEGARGERRIPTGGYDEQTMV